MKQKLLFAAATAALMAVPSLSHAQDQDSGWYLRGNLGYGFHADAKYDLPQGSDVESEGGLAASVGVGYDLANNWRLELDATGLKSDTGTLGSFGEVDTKLSTTALMFNVIHDFSDFDLWEPYVGAGVGLVKANVAAFDRGVVGINDSDTGIGWQILAGLGYSITDNLVWDTNYKYMDGGKANIEGLVAAGPTSFDTTVDDIGGHTLMTGFRYRFGDAAPAAPLRSAPVAVADVQCWNGSMVFNSNQCPAEPVVVAQPTIACWDGSMVFAQNECPTRETFTCPDGTLVFDMDSCPVRTTMLPSELCADQYRQEIIYYEFDKGQSAETRNTINRILDIGQFCNVQNIRVVGHTDSSGPASYNLALSQRRAKDARDELVRQGVAGEVISSEGKGETELFVQTGDGVKEQLNRRTEVLITLGSLGAQSFTN